jgi:thiol-disulfide isomerase/thioredoxin
MTYLTVAVVVFGALSVFNLVLALAIIRWVQARGTGRAAPLRRLPAGTEIADFSVTTMSGVPHSLSDMSGARSLVAFLSPNCQPCRDQLPELARLAREDFPDPARVLVVMTGNIDAVNDFVADLRGIAQIVYEASRGLATTAFSVPGYPSFYILDDHGRVETSGLTVRSLAVKQFA